MRRHKELSSVVNDLTQSLNSRNNDYLGYWATGQLHKLAKDKDTFKINIDVLNNEMKPYTEHFKNIIEIYRLKLEKQLKARKLKLKWVYSFKLEFCFEQEKNEKLHHWVGTGKPYVINVSLESDLGHVYEASAGAYSRPHDSNLETKRNGF